jgi:hypothetical protein
VTTEWMHMLCNDRIVGDEPAREGSARENSWRREISSGGLSIEVDVSNDSSACCGGGIVTPGRGRRICQLRGACGPAVRRTRGSSGTCSAPSMSAASATVGVD